MDSEKKHLVNQVATASDNVQILATQYDANGNKYVVGNCFDCGVDSLGYVQKNEDPKLLFSTSFQNKKGKFFQVSEDSEVIALLVNNITESGVTYNNVDYSSTNEDQLVLFVLNNDLTVAYTKKVLNSSTLGLIEKDGYDLSIDLDNNIYTQVYLSDGKVTVDEVNETFGSAAIIQLTKWNASGTHQWSKNLTFSNVSFFETSLMTTDMKGNIYVAGALGSDGFQFDNDWSNHSFDNKMFCVKVDTTFNVRNHSVFTQRNDVYQSELYSINAGNEQAFIVGAYHEGDQINAYFNFNSDKYNKGYFIGCMYDSRFDNYASIYLDDPALIKKENIALAVDSLENYYVAVKSSSKMEVKMDWKDEMYVSEFSSGLNIYKLTRGRFIKGYGGFIFDGIDCSHLDIDLTNEIKVNANLTGEGSLIQSRQNVKSIASTDRSIHIGFDLQPNTDFKAQHAILSSKEIKIGGSAVVENNIRILSLKDNIFYGLSYLRNDGGVSFENNNGDRLSIDKDFNLIESDTEYQLNGEGEYSMYAYSIDIYNKKVSWNEVKSVAYLPIVDGKNGSPIALSNIEHHADKNIVKYISDEITLEHEFNFTLNGDTTLLVGEDKLMDNSYPIRAHEGQKAQLVFYMDYKNGYFSYEIISEKVSKVNDVRFDSLYDYVAIEADVENNIYRLGPDFESNSNSNLQKLNHNGEVLLSKVFSLNTIDVFGNNLKVDEVSGNMMVVLQNDGIATSFTYDDEIYTLEAGARSVIVYLDKDLKILNYASSAGISDDISVTVSAGLGYYAEYEHTQDIIYVYRLDADKLEEVTSLQVNNTGSYYIITLTADKQGLLYLSGEFRFNGMSTVKEGELEAFKNRGVNAPLIAINSSDGTIKWAKALISGEWDGGVGWPTGFQAGDSSVYITGWINESDTLLEDHLIPNIEDIDVGPYSNFVLKVDHNGNAVWSELLSQRKVTHGYNYGYTRILVGEDESLYYLLDIRSDVFTEGQDVIYTTSKNEPFNALIKYSKEGVREKVTPLRPVLFNLKDMVKIDDQVIITGGYAEQDEYLNYQDHKFINRGEDQLSYSVFVQDEFSFAPKPDDTFTEVTWNINLQPMIEVSLFNPEVDSLQIMVKGASTSILQQVTDHNENGIYTFKYVLPKGDLSYELSVNGRKEEIEAVRTFTVSDSENTIDVMYQFSKYEEFKEEHLVVENIDKEAISIKLDETLFASLTGVVQKFVLMQENGDPVPDYVVFDEVTKTITIDVTKLPSSQRVAALEDLKLIVVGSDELQNYVAVEIILTLDEYLKEIDNDVTSLDSSLKGLVEVFPTKTEGVINIHTALNNYEVGVYDINGKLLYSAVSSLNTIIKTDTFTSGLLIIRIKSNEGISTFKVFK
ncbi:T9SS type A sorting domain-containing protein [Flammeovirga aprica]|uniref:T9SS type A sorting domain-containing protein n=1 Tax=Flammeovirga aprica JL-4 TaxID=694437 RepID=A0A7X9XD45_9BACT|nr:T9SS type A sorting domain-containing protein [Flammeovirga aprica]NME72506.1 T9SS type A sorting domain-containing protein [Flammeovirga aprica JL-4]